MSATHFKSIRDALILFTTIFISSSFFAQEELSDGRYGVLFKVAEYTITETEQNEFKTFCEDNIYDVSEIILIGHTDNDGDDEYNQELSKNRVETVKDLLISYGYPEEIIKIEFHGEEDPLKPNSTDEHKRVNRRVTVEWLFKEVQEPKGNISDLYKQLRQENQVFCIDPTRDTVLVLKQGTVIGIPANSFKTKSDDCVTFKAREIYKTSDMILENLTTSSNGKLLETGGMLYTEATDSRGNKVKINDDKKLTLMLPTDTLREDMKLFYGNDDSHQEEMNWKIASEKSGNRDIGRYYYYYCYPWAASYQCERCNLFCRWFGGEGGKTSINGNQLTKGKSIRRCQRYLRKRKIDRYSYNWSNVDYCDSINKMYDGKTWEQIQDTLRQIQEQRFKAQMDEYGVESLDELRDTLAKVREVERQKQFEEQGEALGRGEGDIDELKYYVAGTQKLGWINCDAFSQARQSALIAMEVDLKRDSETDCMVVFKDRKSVMGADAEGRKFKFGKILPGLAVWILSLKFANDKIYLGLQDTKTSRSTDDVEFKEVTIDELKTELRKLDL